MSSASPPPSRRRGGPGPGRCATLAGISASGLWPQTHLGRQLGHTDLSVTSIYMQGSGHAEIINGVHAAERDEPASAGLRL